MVSPWEQSDADRVEIEVDARPSLDAPPGKDVQPDAFAAQYVSAAGQAAQLLRVVAWLIPVVSILGNLVTRVWIDDQGMSGLSMRQRIGNLLTSVWVPLALAALVYATSFMLVLYASRIELDATRRDRPGDR